MRSSCKVWRKTTCQLCWQQHQRQGRGTKRTIFLLVKTRRTNWQSSCPSVVTEKSSTIVTGCTDKVVHRSVYISRELSLLRRVTLEERLNRPMKRKNVIIISNRPTEGKMR